MGVASGVRSVSASAKQEPPAMGGEPMERACPTKTATAPVEILRPTGPKDLRAMVPI
jgi:hypothetical protein